MLIGWFVQLFASVVAFMGVAIFALPAGGCRFSVSLRMLLQVDHNVLEQVRGWQTVSKWEVDGVQMKSLLTEKKMLKQLWASEQMRERKWEACIQKTKFMLHIANKRD